MANLIVEENLGSDNVKKILFLNAAGQKEFVRL